MSVARKLAGGALKARLVACVNLVPRMESRYWWQGKIERSAEVLLILKTTAARVAKLERYILAAHPYDTPEFLVVKLDQGSGAYLDWISCSSKP